MEPLAIWNLYAAVSALVGVAVVIGVILWARARRKRSRFNGARQQV